MVICLGEGRGGKGRCTPRNSFYWGVLLNRVWTFIDLRTVPTNTKVFLCGL